MVRLIGRPSIIAPRCGWSHTAPPETSCVSPPKTSTVSSPRAILIRRHWPFRLRVSINVALAMIVFNVMTSSVAHTQCHFHSRLTLYRLGTAYISGLISTFPSADLLAPFASASRSSRAPCESLGPSTDDHQALATRWSSVHAASILHPTRLALQAGVLAAEVGSPPMRLNEAAALVLFRTPQASFAPDQCSYRSHAAVSSTHSLVTTAFQMLATG